MSESYPLITTIVASVVFAFFLGLVAKKLKLPSIFGYLMAGVIVGPYTPGFVADMDLTKQLAEIGIILLMFGVGLHFSLKDLMSVRNIAIPGAILQIVLTTLLGYIVIVLIKHDVLEGIIFGLAISVASTVVLLRSLEQYKMTITRVGKIAVGWLIVEDIVMVLVIVLLPMLADFMITADNLDLSEVVRKIFLTLFKILVFILVMIFAGRRILPKVLTFISQTNSRELMSLGTLSIALGFAFVAYSLFDASFALGAFLAGMALNESEVGKESAKEALPLRDTFAVLFFISVGMLFDPMVIIKKPLMVTLILAIIVIGKAVFAYAITRFFKYPVSDSLIIAVSLAQIGEFSFILSGLALNMKIFSTGLYNLILAGALISIAINPFLFKFTKKFINDSQFT
jgi:CPA2 family monovalent cation:H+ antiporter-2